MNLTKAIQAELIKLKYPPILWLVGFILFTTLLIVFSAHYIDIHKTVTLGRSPWAKLNAAAQAMFSIFITVPFVVLFISSVVFIEHQNKGLKQFYALPITRMRLLIYKLIAFILCLLATIGLLIIGLILCGYLLNLIYPETEFTYYSPPFLSMVKSFGLIFISLLGIIGIQFFLSLRFKGFLVPASFGILAYVLGLILGSVNSSLSLYFPYSYPIIAREHGVFDNSALGIEEFWGLNQVEIFSIVFFFVFITLSFYTERKKNI